MFSLQTIECCKNWSTGSQLNAVNELLRKEFENSYLYGSIFDLPWQSVGSCGGNILKVKRFILDSSAPHQIDIFFNVHELVDKDISFVTIDSQTRVRFAKRY